MMRALGAARTAQQRQRLRRGLFRVSMRFTDVILLAQLIGVLANIVWYLEINTSDFTGFLYVGGDVAGLLAYFGFVLFGVLFFIFAPRRFWCSLHPATLGLALLMLSSQRTWGAAIMLLPVAAAVGWFGGRLLYRPILHYPRLALIATACLIPLLRFVIPRELAAYAIMLFGMLLLTLVLTRSLTRGSGQRFRSGTAQG